MLQDETNTEGKETGLKGSANTNQAIGDPLGIQHVVSLTSALSFGP